MPTTMAVFASLNAAVAPGAIHTSAEAATPRAESEYSRNSDLVASDRSQRRTVRALISIPALCASLAVARPTLNGRVILLTGPDTEALTAGFAIFARLESVSGSIRPSQEDRGR